MKKTIKAIPNSFRNLVAAILAAGLAFACFGCKVNLDPSYTIAISEAEHGNVTTSAGSAVAGSAITLTVTPESGYNLDKLTVTDASGNSVLTTEVTAGEKYTFTMPASNVNVSAMFVKLYTVKFNTDGGREVESQTVIAGMTATKPADPTKTGYAFLYWSVGEANAFDFDQTITSNIALTAKWLEGFVKVEGTTFDGTKTLTPESKVFISGRSITIGDLYVCDHEVTQAEYETYCKYDYDSLSPSETPYGKGDNFPAYYVNWYDAVVYCNLRSIAENLTPAYSINNETDPSKWTGIVSDPSGGTTKYCGPYSNDTTWNSLTYNTTADGYRLPTEAEWEYIARGGSEWKTYTYSGSDTIGDVAWYLENSEHKTHEVKTKNANSLGIHDMSGNVSEWCYDWSSSSISTDTPATGAASGSYRVHRGSDYLGTVATTSVSSRGRRSPRSRDSLYGFRVVRNAN